jgi:hypothetical protein
VVCYEDRVALSYLRSRPEVRAESLACLGLSGGGNRAAMLLATAEQPLAAAAIVGLMCTYEGMLDHNVASHTWMLWPPGLSPKMDWSDLAACRAPAPLLVQYDEGDELFTLEGMRAAHARIAGHYAGIGRAEAYAGQFYPGPHKFDLPMQAAAFGWLCVRLSGVYLAMLTLAFAQITWSLAWQWDSVTGGSNGLIGVWPAPWVADRTAFYFLVLAVVVLALLALVRVGRAPVGFALRGVRDSPLRAAALGIDVRNTQWRGFALAGAFAGLAGGLFAFSKGSISPESLAIPRSVDALVMVLLGGLNALFGPLLGAAAFTWLSDTLARFTDYWRAGLGVLILALVLLFPMGIGGALARVLRRGPVR